MSFRTTAALFGILIAVLMLFGLMLARQRSQLDPGFVIPTLAKEKDVAIGTVEVGGEGKTYVFFKSGSGWRLRLPSSKVDVRADDAKVRELIDQVRQARKSDEADITRNLAQWGLENPLGRITLKTASGDKEWTLFLGRTSPDKAYVYVNSSDRPRDVLAVRRKQLDSALITPETITKYRSTRLLDGIFTTTALKLTQPGEKDGPVLALEKNAQGAWWFKTPAYGPAESSGSAEARAADPKSIVGVQGLLSALDAIRVESDKDFETPGKNVFPESKALLRVEVQHAEEGGKARPPEVLLVGDKVGGKSEEYYARLASDDAVVRVAARNVEAVLEVLKKPDSLRSRDVAQIEPNRPDVVRVSRGAKLADVTTLFRARGDEWKVVAGSLRHRANEQAIQGADGLLTAVQGKGKVLTFIDVSDAKQGAAKDKELGLDAPVAEVAIWIDGLDTDTPKKEEKKDDKAKKDDKKEKKDDKAKKEDKKEEKKDEEPRLKAGAKPALKLTFARKDDKKDTTVYVKRETADGIISRVSVPASVLDKLLPAEGPLAYLATNLATFRAADVMKLELKLPGRTFVAMREQPKKDEKKDGKKDDKKDDKKGEKKVEKKDEGKEPPPKGWLLVEPASFKDRPYADREQLDRILHTLTDLTATRYVEKVDAKSDLGKYGLAKAPVSVSLTLKKEGDKDKEPVLVYHFGSETRKEKGKEKEMAGVYGLIVSGSDLKDTVFVVPEQVVSVLKDAELRDRTVFKFDPDKVKEVKLEIKDRGEIRKPVFERKKATGPWTVKSGVEGFDLNSDKVEILVNYLSDLKAERYINFTGPDKSHQLDKDAKLKIEVVMDDNKTTHKLEIGALEGMTYFAQSNSLPGAVFTVPQSRFQPILDNWLKHFGKGE